MQKKKNNKIKKGNIKKASARKKSKMPVVDKILKQLTPERIEKEIKAIQAVKLPPELQKWVKEYEKVGDRDEFIWKWLHAMFQIIILPSVTKKYYKSLILHKTLLTMFICQIDDVADKFKNKVLLDAILKIPDNENYKNVKILKKKDREYFVFTQKLWVFIIHETKKYPRYLQIKEIFNFDIKQVLNAINYSYLINAQPYLINKTESWLHLPYNMVSMVYSDFDIMCSLKWRTENTGVFREILLEAQKMARIGNWVSTWEREIGENDLTNGLFILFSKKNRIDEMEKIFKNKTKTIESIKKSHVRNQLLSQWQEHYYSIKNLAKNLSFRDKKMVAKILIKMQTLLFLHLLSQGYK